MSKNKQRKFDHKYNTKNGQKQPQMNNVKSGATKKKNIFNSTPKFPLFSALFLALWLFLYFMYGDMMAVAEQRSFFAFDSVAMQPYLSQPLGWLYATGRFMLLSCVSPILGTLLITIMLTLTAWYVDRALGLKGWGHAIAILLPFGYIAYMFYMGLNMVYLRELSWIMTIPLLALIASFICAVVCRFVRKCSICACGICKQVEAKNGRQIWVLYGLLVVLLIGSVAVAKTYAENDRVTCSMERLMYEEDWDGMVEQAKSVSQPSRTIAGLYAIALNQNGQLASELFNIPFQYKNAHLTRNNGEFDGGMDFIVINCNFYAGLTRAAYHEAMEQTVLEGPSIDKIKTMVKCALIDQEFALAEKYLAILKKVPFEWDFVEKYSAMLGNYNLVAADHTLASVIELQPVNDSFEQTYREPLFLGYNVSLSEAKSIRGLNNSLYACLYSKDMQGFGMRIVTMLQNNVQLSKVFEEAIVVQNIKNLSVLKQIKLQPYILQGMKDFMGDCFSPDEKPAGELTKEEKNKISKEKGRRFIDKYLGTYQFYYYFQNIPDENYVIPTEGEKGGVN